MAPCRANPSPACPMAFPLCCPCATVAARLRTRKAGPGLPGVSFSRRIVSFVLPGLAGWGACANGPACFQGANQWTTKRQEQNREGTTPSRRRRGCHMSCPAARANLLCRAASRSCSWQAQRSVSRRLWRVVAMEATLAVEAVATPRPSPALQVRMDRVASAAVAVVAALD